MRKLALFSYHIKPNAQIRLQELLGKDIHESRIAVIPTASNVYKDNRPWYEENIQELTDMGFIIEDVELEDYVEKKDELFDKLSTFDAIYVSGGNTFVLRYYAQETGFDRFLPALLDKGIVYIGSSAGSIVFNPDMAPIALVDEPDKAAEIVSEGIRLLDFVVIPHWESPEEGDLMVKVKEDYEAQGVKTVCLTDTQGAIIEDDDVEIIG